MDPPSGASPVEPLQKPVSGEFDVLMTPLGRPVVAGDQARSVDAAEVTIDERVAALSEPYGHVTPTMRSNAAALFGSLLHAARTPATG
jgi:hypothetical protein